MAEIFPSLMKNLYLHTEEAQWIPSRIDTKGFTNRHCRDKMKARDEEKNLESNKRKVPHYT